jgi:branched-chain amino acid transport system ATP-binding protein
LFFFWRVHLGAPLLSINGVTKHFGGLAAVNGVSFDIHEGESVGLMGPNGAGKTTLINLIAGVYRPDTGEIKFKGKDIAGLPPHKICHIGVARTYQVPQPFKTLTAQENIIAAAIFGGGLQRAQAEREAARILDELDLSGKTDMITEDMDEVALKRLELGRVLATKPSLLLVDEVAAGLTEVEIPRVLEILREIRNTGITILLIEHIMKVMTEAVGRIVVMVTGVKMAEGVPEDVMHNKKVIEAYLGEPED